MSKFRVYDKQEKKYVKGLFIDENGNIYTLRRIDFDIKASEELDPDRYVVEFSTGLRDKNGVEIFEGDICRIKFDIAKVEDYIYNSLTKKELEDGERIFIVESPLFNNQQELNVDDIEVIGNIHGDENGKDK